MRIIGGRLRGRRLAPVPGNRIRPSSDLLRESVFNILGPRVIDATVVDLYAGTGSLGLEALSRGAASAVFVDSHAQSVKILSRNLKACVLETQSAVYKRDVLRGIDFLKSTRKVYNLVFMDPPYDKGYAVRTLCLLGESPSITEDVCVVVEHSLTENLPEKCVRLERTEKRRYGKALVSFYESVL